MKGPGLVVGTLLMLAPPAGAAGNSLFVDDDAPKGGDGAAWETALRSLQDALALARDMGGSVIEIRVGAGVYKTDDGEDISPGDRTVSFDLVSAVALEGGYAGVGAPDPDERDIIAYESVLAGDLAGDDLPGFVNYEDNSLHVVTATGVSDGTTIDGFTIRGGYQNEFGEGGGLLAHGGGLSIIDCLFVANAAQRGGGAALIDTSAQVSGCMFDTNRCLGTGVGGGLYALGGAPGLGNCLFFDNSTTFEDGGGLYAPGASLLAFDCDFLDNGADDGGGAYLGDASLLIACRFEDNGAAFGGAMASFAHPVLIDCHFLANSAGDGGGIYGGGTFVNCVLVGNEGDNGGGALIFNETLFMNALFNGNSSSFTGGGGASVVGETDARFVNSTFTQNTSPGGIAGAAFGNGTFRSCIIWNNFPLELLGSPTVTYSCVRNGWPGDGNIDEDPRFRDPAGEDGTPGTIDDDLRLDAESPCIDAGDNTTVPPDTYDLDDDGDVAEATPVDLDGAARFVDDPTQKNTGKPDGLNPQIDIGAFEFQPSPLIPGDIDGDGDVDSDDLLLLLAGWGPCPDPPAECPADVNGNGSVDFSDLLIVLSHWS